MKIYRIIEDDMKAADTQNQESKAMLAVKSIGKTALKAAAPIPAGGLAVLKQFGNQAVSLQLSEAWSFINATNADWKLGALYAEHPRRKQMLIPVGEYKDYIKREMVSDIANYVMDHLSVKRILIGVVSSRNSGADAAVMVSEVNANANLSCKIERKYIVKYEGVIRSVPKVDYIWIDQFPDVKSAVEHQTKHFEVINETTVDLNTEAGIAEKFTGSLNKGKTLQLYISFECE